MKACSRGTTPRTAKVVDHAQRRMPRNPPVPRVGVDPRGSPCVLHIIPCTGGPAGVPPAGGSFQGNGRTTSIRADGRLIATVNEGATTAAGAGSGTMSTVGWGCRTELANGALVEVLTDWKMDTVEMHAGFPAGRAAKPSARAFVDYLRTALAE